MAPRPQIFTNSQFLCIMASRSLYTVISTADHWLLSSSSVRSTPASPWIHLLSLICLCFVMISQSNSLLSWRILDSSKHAHRLAGALCYSCMCVLALFISVCVCLSVCLHLSCVCVCMSPSSPCMCVSVFISPMYVCLSVCWSPSPPCVLVHPHLHLCLSHFPALHYITGSHDI